MHLCKLIKNKKKFLNFNLSLKKEYHNCQPDWRWPLPAQLRLKVAVMARYLAWRLTSLPSLPSLPYPPVASSAWCQLTRGESGDQGHCLGNLQVQALLTLKLCLLLWHHAPSSISGRGRAPSSISGRGRAPSGILGRGRAPMS